MINYLLDNQSDEFKDITSLATATAFLKTADFNSKIQLLAYLLENSSRFEDAELRAIFNTHYPISFFKNIVYNTSIENYIENGKATIVTLLIRLQQFLNEDAYTEVLDDFLKTIVFQLRFSPQLYHHDDQQWQSPVGFDKGNSGIAYALLALATYFNSNDILQLCIALIRYEDSQLASSDYHTYQTPIQSVEELEIFKKAYSEKDENFFKTRERSISPQEAWKLFMVRILLHQKNDKVAQIAVLKKLVALMKTDSTLSEAYKWCQSVIDSLRNNSQFPEFQEEDFLPKVTVTASNNFTYEGFVIQQISISFRRTIALFNALEIDIIATFKEKVNVCEANTNFHNAFHKHCIRNIANLSESHKACIAEIVAFEYKSIQMQHCIKNYLWLHVQDMVYVTQREQILAKSDEAFLKTIMQANPSGELIQTSWNWLAEEIFERLYKVEINLQSPPNQFYCFKIPLGVINLEKKTNIKEIILTEYEYIIVDLFEFPATIEDVIKEFSTIFEIENQEDYQKIQVFTKEIIKTLIFKKCLILSSSL